MQSGLFVGQHRRGVHTGLDCIAQRFGALVVAAHSLKKVPGEDGEYGFCAGRRHGI
jgi:hypothetical protein